ncbi:MAG: 30S ribosomal protein S5 [Promethearchaeota archaeon]
MTYEKSIDDWTPRTRVGKMVKEGYITSIEEIFQSCLTIKEPEIVDLLLPKLQEEVLAINLVQKQTDAGEKSRFRATVAIGNKDGYLGIGEGKSVEIGPAIRSAIVHAKLYIIPVRRGCGSWQCTCHEPHSIPFTVTGKSGSVRITLKPAPKGTGLVTAKTPRTVLDLTGIQDIWSSTKGHTRSTINFAKATYDALRNTYKILSPQLDWERTS